MTRSSYNLARRDASASTAIWTGYLVNHNGPRLTVADVEYAYPVFTPPVLAFQIPKLAVGTM
jgi:hypothetical protein